MKFKEGQQLKSILLADGGSISINANIESITVVMENGQMAHVPWARVLYFDGRASKFNLALVEGVEEMPPQQEGEQ